MLVISRKCQERFFIDVGGERITVTIVEIVRNHRVRVGIEASKAVKVYREEIAPAPPKPAIRLMPEAPNDLR